MRKTLSYIPVPVVTLLTIAGFSVAAQALSFLPNIVNARALSAIVLLTIVLYAAIKNGIRSSLINALLAQLYFLFIYSIPGKLFHYTDENLWRVIIIGISLTSLAVLVGLFRQKFYTSYEQEKMAREKAENKAQKLQKSGERKEEFLSIASHELKTPITSIKLGVHALKIRAKKEKNPQLTLQLTRIDNQINNLTGLINELLDVSRMATGKLVLNRQECDIDQLIDEKIEEIKALDGTHPIIKKGKITKTLTVDRARIGQVIINLLTNAIRYSPETSQVIVAVKGPSSHKASQATEALKDKSKGQGYVTISVQDFGEGIAKSHQKKIFQRFYQIYEQQQKGTLGIGLYISNQIIKLHNGQISVKSQKGKGSTFTITLPT